jgi:hypothetical protein
MKRYERPGDPPLQKWEPIDPEALVGLKVEMTIHPHAYEPQPVTYTVMPDGPQPSCIHCGKGISNPIHRMPAPRHTIESHERDYLTTFGHPCDDPDCEFHGDIRFEDTIG